MTTKITVKIDEHVTLIEVCAISLATGMSFDHEAIPVGLYSQVVEMRPDWKECNNIGEMAVAYLKRRNAYLFKLGS